MAECLLDARVIKAQEAFDQAEAALRIARGRLTFAFGEVLSEAGHNPAKTVVPVNGWDCKKSPIGKCVYDCFEDPCRDECLFCHDPADRP